MVNSRIIRIVVSFCLIAAIVTQPIAVTAAQTRCQATKLSPCSSPISDSQHLCDGCGNCDVSAAGELCGCCSRGKEVDGEVPCCGTSSAGAATESEPDPIFGELSELVPEPGVPGNMPKGSAFTNRSSSPVVMRVCLCTLKSQPVTPSAPRVPVSEESDGQLVSFDDEAFAGHDRNAAKSLREAFSETQEYLLLDSQRHLCVWRL